MRQRKTTDQVVTASARSSAPSPSASIEGVKANEELRSNHVRTLQVTQRLENENMQLKQQLAQLQKPNGRMKQEELDSLYVEERRLIESLEKENAALKQTAAGAKATRDSDVAAAQAEVRHLSGMCEELRGEKRRDMNLAASQLEKVRTAFKAELERKAAECEEARFKLQEAGIDLGVERSRGDSLERKLADAQAQLAAGQGSAPDEGDAVTALRDQLLASRAKCDIAWQHREEAVRRAEAAERAASAAREAEAAAKAAGTEAAARAEAALEEERRQRKADAAAAKKELAARQAGWAARESSLQEEIQRLTSLLEAQRSALVLPKVTTAPAPAAIPDDGRSVFTDFIALKRELAALKDENARLRTGVLAGGVPFPSSSSSASRPASAQGAALLSGGGARQLMAAAVPNSNQQSSTVVGLRAQPQPRALSLGASSTATSSGCGSSQQLAGSLAVGRRQLLRG